MTISARYLEKMVYESYGGVCWEGCENMPDKFIDDSEDSYKPSYSPDLEKVFDMYSEADSLLCENEITKEQANKISLRSLIGSLNKEYLAYGIASVDVEAILRDIASIGNDAKGSEMIECMLNHIFPAWEKYRIHGPSKNGSVCRKVICIPSHYGDRVIALKYDEHSTRKEITIRNFIIGMTDVINRLRYLNSRKF